MALIIVIVLGILLVWFGLSYAFVKIGEGAEKATKHFKQNLNDKVEDGKNE